MQSLFHSNLKLGNLDNYTNFYIKKLKKNVALIFIIAYTITIDIY